MLYKKKNLNASTNPDEINKLIQIAPVLKALEDADLDLDNLDEETLDTLYEIGSTMAIVGDFLKRRVDSTLSLRF